MSQVSDRFSRVRDLYGEAAFARFRRARVVVVGLGGVGAHAALALARSGIGSLLLCDFDLITPTSLNRHPFATDADVGREKTEVLAEHLARTCPHTRIEARTGFVDDQAAVAILGAEPGDADGPGRLPERIDLVLDAIDSLGPKVALLAHCVRRGIPVASSMGASSRRDAGSLRIGDIRETRGCPLARLVRSRLRRAGIQGGILCVYSIEPPGMPLAPDEGDDVLRRGRPRTRQPSAICLPGIFGYALASLALELLAPRHEGSAVVSSPAAPRGPGPSRIPQAPPANGSRTDP